MSERFGGSETFATLRANQNGVTVAEHQRSFGRGETVYETTPGNRFRVSVKIYRYHIRRTPTRLKRSNRFGQRPEIATYKHILRADA